MLLITEKEKPEKYQQNMQNKWKDETNKNLKHLKEVEECAEQEKEGLKKKMKRSKNYSPKIDNLSLQQRKYRMQIEQTKEVYELKKIQKRNRALQEKQNYL